jgi:hemerythrin
MPGVALESMQQVHLEEVGLINRLGEMVIRVLSGELDPQPINQAVTEWVEHTRAHFEAENRLMKTFAFPPYSVHEAEHAEVLMRIEEVQNRWMSEGNITELADFIFVEWRAWFDQHVRSMDRVTAEFLNLRM